MVNEEFILKRGSSNNHDSNAVEIQKKGTTVGHLPGNSFLLFLKKRIKDWLCLGHRRKSTGVLNMDWRSLAITYSLDPSNIIIIKLKELVDSLKAKSQLRTTVQHKHNFFVIINETNIVIIIISQ